MLLEWQNSISVKNNIKKIQEEYQLLLKQIA